MCVCVCARARVRVCVSVFMYTDIYIYIYIYTHTHTHIYTFICIYIYICTHSRARTHTHENNFIEGKSSFCIGSLEQNSNNRILRFPYHSQILDLQDPLRNLDKNSVFTQTNTITRNIVKKKNPIQVTHIILRYFFLLPPPNEVWGRLCFHRSLFVTLQNQILQSIVDGPVCFFVCLFVCFFVCYQAVGRNSCPITFIFFLVIGIYHL